MDSRQAFEEAQFEEEARRAFGRIEAPEQFAERLHARMLARPVQPASLWGRWLAVSCLPRVAWPAAVATVLLVAGLTREQHLKQQRAQAAAVQWDQALQVTGRALDHATAQLNRGELGTISQALQALPAEQTGEQK